MTSARRWCIGLVAALVVMAVVPVYAAFPQATPAQQAGLEASASIEWKVQAGFYWAEEPSADAQLRLVADSEVYLRALLSVLTQMRLEEQHRLALRLREEAEASQRAGGNGGSRQRAGAAGTLVVKAEHALRVLGEVDGGIARLVEARLGLNSSAGARARASGYADPGERQGARTDGQVSGSAEARAQAGASAELQAAPGSISTGSDADLSAGGSVQLPVKGEGDGEGEAKTGVSIGAEGS